MKWWQINNNGNKWCSSTKTYSDTIEVKEYLKKYPIFPYSHHSPDWKFHNLLSLSTFLVTFLLSVTILVIQSRATCLYLACSMLLSLTLIENHK